MFNKLFGLQHSDTNTDNEIRTMAAIKYIVDDKGEIHVDIELEDYTDQSVIALSKCLTTLAMDESYLQTVQMIQNSLQADGQDEALLKLYNVLAANPNDKAVRIHKEKKRATPCIRPSDML